MKISIRELRQSTEALLNHLEELGYDELDVTEDFYWSIPDEKLYSVHQEPSGFTIGQISDDWNELQQIVSRKKEPLAYGFVWLSSVFRYLGARIVW